MKKIVVGQYNFFKNIKPSSDEVVTSYLKANKTDYLTGNNVFKSMGLTTQVANSVTIATNRTPKTVELYGMKIKFVAKKADAKDIFAGIFDVKKRQKFSFYNVHISQI